MQPLHHEVPIDLRRLQAAEAEYGFALFERRAGKIRCTPEGEFIVNRLRKLLQENRQLERDIGLFRDTQLGELSFGIGPFAAPSLLPGLLVRLPMLEQLDLRAELAIISLDGRSFSPMAALAVQILLRLAGRLAPPPPRLPGPWRQPPGAILRP